MSQQIKPVAPRTALPLSLPSFDRDQVGNYADSYREHLQSLNDDKLDMTAISSTSNRYIAPEPTRQPYIDPNYTIQPLLQYEDAEMDLIEHRESGQKTPERSLAWANNTNTSPHSYPASRPSTSSKVAAPSPLSMSKTASRERQGRVQLAPRAAAQDRAPYEGLQSSNRIIGLDETAQLDAAVAAIRERLMSPRAEASEPIQQGHASVLLQADREHAGDGTSSQESHLSSVEIKRQVRENGKKKTGLKASDSVRTKREVKNETLNLKFNIAQSPQAPVHSASVRRKKKVEEEFRTQLPSEADVRAALHGPAAAANVDAGPYLKINPKAPNQTAPAGDNILSLLPEVPTHGADGEEICIECMLRDKDLEDVSVAPATWARQSDGEFWRILHEKVSYELNHVPVAERVWSLYGQAPTEVALQALLASKPPTSGHKQKVLSRFVSEQRKILSKGLHLYDWVDIPEEFLSIQPKPVETLVPDLPPGTSAPELTQSPPLGFLAAPPSRARNISGRKNAPPLASRSMFDLKSNYASSKLSNSINPASPALSTGPGSPSSSNFRIRPNLRSAAASVYSLGERSTGSMVNMHAAAQRDTFEPEMPAIAHQRLEPHYMRSVSANVSPRQSEFEDDVKERPRQVSNKSLKNVWKLLRGSASPTAVNDRLASASPMEDMSETFASPQLASSPRYDSYAAAPTVRNRVESADQLRLRQGGPSNSHMRQSSYASARSIQSALTAESPSQSPYIRSSPQVNPADMQSGYATRSLASRERYLSGQGVRPADSIRAGSPSSGPSFKQSPQITFNGRNALSSPITQSDVRSRELDFAQNENINIRSPESPTQAQFISPVIKASHKLGWASLMGRKKHGGE